jgi:hypothetical protein
MNLTERHEKSFVTVTAKAEEKGHFAKPRYRWNGSTKIS